MELVMMKFAEHSPGAAMFAWIMLCMIYASLRFDDALHTKPSTIKYISGVLYGRCWQTKVDRKRRGTFFAVPDVSIADVPWLTTGKAVYDSLVEQDENTDFWIPTLITWKEVENRPCEYNTFIKWMRGTLRAACTIMELEIDLNKFTGHTLRVTMINASSHNMESGVAQWFRPIGRAQRCL